MLNMFNANLDVCTRTVLYACEVYLLTCAIVTGTDAVPVHKMYFPEQNLVNISDNHFC